MVFIYLVFRFWSNDPVSYQLITQQLWHEFNVGYKIVFNDKLYLYPCHTSLGLICKTFNMRVEETY